MSINIDLKQCDEKIVDKYVAHYGISVRGGLNAKVNALEKYTLSTDPVNVPEADHSTKCTKCGGVSDFNLPECPYCGAVEVDDVPKALPANAVAAADNEGPNTTATHEPLEPASEPLAASAAATELQPVTSKAKGKQKLAKVEKPKPTNGHSSMAQTTTTELVAAVELDAAVVRVHDALRLSSNGYWELGRALLDIFDRQLWKQRIVGGRQKFPSWNMFCREELAMSHVNAFSIMDAARAFSKTDFEEIGHVKLRMLLNLPKERQQLLAEEARKGQLPKLRLQEIVEAEAPKEPRATGRRTTTAKATTAAAEKRAARKLPKPDGELTAVSQLGRSTIKLYARPNPKKASAKPSRAMSVTQDPWGEEQLVNGVVVRYTVVKAADGMKLVIERHRGE